MEFNVPRYEGMISSVYEKARKTVHTVYPSSMVSIGFIWMFLAILFGFSTSYSDFLCINVVEEIIN